MKRMWFHLRFPYECCLESPLCLSGEVTNAFRQEPVLR